MSIDKEIFQTNLYNYSHLSSYLSNWPHFIASIAQQCKLGRQVYPAISLQSWSLVTYNGFLIKCLVSLQNASTVQHYDLPHFLHANMKLWTQEHWIRLNSSRYKTVSSIIICKPNCSFYFWHICVTLLCILHNFFLVVFFNDCCVYIYPTSLTFSWYTALPLKLVILKAHVHKAQALLDCDLSLELEIQHF